LQHPVLAGKKYIPKGYRLRLPATPSFKRRAKKLGRRFYHARQIRDRIYIVRKGDTINSIGKKFGLSSRSLIRANHLNHRGLIHVGQKIILPPHKSAKHKDTMIILQDRAKYKPQRQH